MKNLKKYHGTEKVSYRKGVLYEVERISAADDIMGKKNNSGKGTFFKALRSIGGFFGMLSEKLAGLFGKGKPKRFKKTSVKTKPHKKYRRHTKEDKRFYIAASAVGVVVVLLSAVITTVAMAGNIVTINDEGRISYAVVTDGQTVTELLEENNITLSSGDAIEISDEQKLTDGMEIVIHRAMPVTLYADGKKKSVNILAGTVQDVIDESGIELGEYDEVYPEPSTTITGGMTISVIRVDVKQMTETSVIEYKEIRKQSADYKKGEEYLAQAGKNGTLEKEINVVYKDGVEFKREVISTTVIEQAQDEIIYVGTYVAPMENDNSSSDSSGSSGSGSSDYGQNIPAVDGLLTQLPTLSQIHSGTISEHKSVAAPSPDLIAEVVTCETTAYTWTGNKTATGVYPRIGTLAVDPDLIPYGTLVYIPGYGYGRAEDTGGFKSSADGYWIDLYMDSYDECINWGRRNVKIYILKG